ncbi:type IV secretory system conjugative DNA transfer family protein [Thalassospira marina]|uniref:Conjugal transfer protein TraG n=1 Tax=Thalassospira marina TaxID=2048283 RepID=A0ABM6QFW1_9PROT|nr:type IV secretory system conjugative DNA transfer family protein [Thalassospira marina]AUG51500.1 conjugal transfer protein TraG [Thalassospira marina]AUG55268.1 conjugal transfer protein TraG [Thalassospira marina]
MTARLYHFAMFLITLGMLAGVIADWHFSVGFDPRSLEWWQWLYAAAIHPAGLPDNMQYPALVILGSGMLVLIVLAIFSARARNDTVSGNRKGRELHGSARWANWRDIKKSRLLTRKGVVIGGFPRAFGKVRELRHHGPEHVMAFAPTRSGKGVSIILPTLLSWPESGLVLDIKGENYAKTAGWNRDQGKTVLRFDPSNPNNDETVRFNPLAEIRINTRRDIADCQNIANMVVDPDGKGIAGNYWREEGWGWLSVVLLHVIYKVQKEEGRIANFDDVNIFLSGISTVTPPDEAIEGDEETPTPRASGNGDDMDTEDNFVAILQTMATYEHGHAHVNKEVKRGANGMAIKAPQERSGVHSNAKTQLTLYADPIIAENTAVSDFRLNDLMNGEKPTMLYLVFSPADKDRLIPLIRIMMNLFLRRLTEKMEFGDGEQKQGYKHRLLLMLDEFPALGKLEVFEEALAFMAGYGIKAYIIIQNIEQLYKKYGKDESIFANCHVRIAFTPNKLPTAELLSKLAGKQTIVQRKHSRSGKFGTPGSQSENLHEVSRDLLTADEIMRLPMIDVDPDGKKKPKPGDTLIFVGGRPPIWGRQKLYFLDPVLRSRSRVRPPKMTQSLPSPNSSQETTYV